MIDYSALDLIFDELKAVRTDKDLLHDPRDAANYDDSGAAKGLEMLKVADTTGFAAGMLLNELIEATIIASKVRVQDIFRQEGFMQRIGKLMELKQRTDALVAEPTSNFQDRLESMIGAISPAFGRPSTLEVAVCLRDSVYCLEQALKLRWVRCDDVGSHQPVGIHHEVIACATLADFSDRLKGELPYGCFLAKIGGNQTAIGIKKPGRIAYLSCLSVNTHTGKMEQNGQGSLIKRLDLTQPGYRFPNWQSYQRVGDTYLASGDSGIKELKDLERDTLIWLAMVAELTQQEMAKVELGHVRLAESVEVAMTGPEQAAKLPTLYRPNWLLQKPSVTEMLEELQFHDGWIGRFLAPALKGVTADTFLPVGEHDLWINVLTKECIQKSSFSSTPDRIATRHLQASLISMSTGIAGTEEEVHSAIRTVFARNLANYLITWGNNEFRELWENDKQWFIKRVQKNLSGAIDAKSTKLFTSQRAVSEAGGGLAAIYHQNHRRQAFSPLCAFDEKSPIDAIAVVNPQDAEELAAVLGFSSTSKLPEYLRGWQRNAGWPGLKMHHPERRYGVNERWMWASVEAMNSEVFGVKIFFSTKNHALKADFVA